MRARAWLPGLLLACTAFAADSGKALLNAARAGDAAALRSLLGSGVTLEAQDKNGRTPLMLAAEEGHAAAVRLLLEKGARADARDKEGLTAYGLALLSAPGKRKDVLEALPKPSLIRVNVDAAWVPNNMVSSCFLGREELAKTLNGIHPDALLLAQFVELARLNSSDAVDIARAIPEGLKPDAAAMATFATDDFANVFLVVRPGVTCLRGADDLSLQIEVRVIKAAQQRPAYQKTFGGGLKGLHTPPVDNPGQYNLYFQKWTKTHAEPIYWAVLRVLLRQ